MIVNKTPHVVVITDGPTYEPQHPPARVQATYEIPTAIGTKESMQVDGVALYRQIYGEIEGLPEPEAGTLYIVSAIVKMAAQAQGRQDCIAPATGHPDAVRDDQGRIVSVPGFVG